MKEKRNNAVTHFEVETICNGVNVEFTRVVTGDNMTFSGVISKEDAQVGDISYAQKDDYLIVRLKPCSQLTDDEVAAIYAAMPGYAKELINR